MDARFDDATGLAAALAQHARQRPQQVALRFVDEEGVTTLTWRELDGHARAIARTLLLHTEPGERAVLVYPSGPDYVAAFFGCLYAGVIAVPAYPPESHRSQHLARLQGIFADAEPTLVLSHAALAETLGQACAQLHAAPTLLCTDRALLTPAPDWAGELPAADCIAFLQYTSGSTATPKGVQVSHGNLAANEAAIREGFAVGADDVIVSWLPLYHDMGLIGGLLQAIYSGIECVLMSPAYFLQRPSRWLQAIAEYGGTISGGPDFAYRLCCERVRDTALAELDLSRWRVAFSGAEPIRADTLEAFAQRFAGSSFQAASFMACYGLAEATLYVSGGAPRSGIQVLELDRAALAEQRGVPGVGLRIASCGQARGGQQLRIADPLSGAERAPGAVGEVWTCGASVAQGYWRNAEASRDTFVEHGGATWLRTGDLGLLHDGQLYITGRLKDLLIVRGQNLYPQDLEHSLEGAVAGLRAGRVAAFAVLDEGGEEGVGIAAEIARAQLRQQTPGEIVQAIRQALADSHGLLPLAVALLEPGAMPRTSSGKLQRSACRQQLASGELTNLAATDSPPPAVRSAPLSAAEQALASGWAEVLESPPTSAEQSFFGLGGNSLKAMLLVGRLREQYAVPVTVAVIFEQPTLGAMAAWLQAQPREVPREPLRPRPAGSPPVLSAAQSQLWFLWKLDPQAVAYNISGQVKWRGRLDRPALRAALQALVTRHQVLRTRFPEAQGRPQPTLAAPGPVTLTEHDLQAQDPGVREAKARELALEAAHRPFDLGGDAPLRVELTQLDEASFWLQLTLHHIVADGASMNRLIGELAELYAAALQGREAQLPALAVQYADHAAWQQAWLSGGEGARQLAWWREQLGSEHPLLALPSDRPRPAVQGFAGGQVEVCLTPALLKALRSLAGRHQATLAMVLLASFKVLLARYSGQTDLRVGTTVAGRNVPEVEGLIGLFVNLLVLRSDLQGGQSFAQLLGQVKQGLRQAQAHQDLPFEQLVEALQPERNLGHNPLFQVAFDHQWPQLDSLGQWPGLHLQAVEHFQQHTQFDLTLHTLERDDALSAHFTYRQDLFDAASIERLAGHWQQLLAGIVAAPELPIERLALLGAGEGEQLLQRWNPTGAQPLPVATQDSLHQRIALQAQRRPGAIALTCEGRHLTYAALDQRANALAWVLREQGVGPDVLVGLAMERSFELIVGLLAILKAGGAYLPLDPSYPHERLAYLRQDSGVQLLLVDQAGTPAWAAGLPTLCPAQLALAPRSDAPPAAQHADQLAYVIYTSGSTGQPKGAMISHRNVLRLFDSAAQTFAFDERDVWSLFHAYAFDFSVWEIFGALLHGARLLLVPYLTSRDPQTFYSLLCREGVTVLNQTPSAFRGLMGAALSPAASTEPAPALRYVVFGGEALDMPMLRPWLARLGEDSPQLINMYGITETTVHVTFRRLCAADLHGQNSPIGAPLADLRWYCLDSQGEPVPLGVAGELYIGGAGLARGYLGRPGLTAERFCASPFAPGERLYRTGDLARLGHDGSVQYLGRIDQQVKLRGFRIELGEIEAQLYAQPAVREAVVRVRNAAGDSQLVAYVVADAQALRGQDEADTQGQAERVGQWSTVFDGIYSGATAASVTDAEHRVVSAPSFIGWNDSYGDRPIPEAQMQEWLDCTTARILALNPQRVLEIGCGVGLLTQQLAPRCTVYRGTDLSHQAVANLSAWVATRADLGHVRLSQQPATDFSGIEAGAYDTVVINSVAQYFPDVDYLVQVLEGALTALCPGGQLFLGDLRALDLQPTFHASVQLHQADPELPLADLPIRIERSIAEDAELLLAPGFFAALRSRLPRLGACRLQLRRGRAGNELTRYRYDAVLQAGAALPVQAQPDHAWQAEGNDLQRLATLLEQQRPARVQVQGLANARLAADQAIVHGMQVPGLRTVGDLLAWRAAQSWPADDPEDYWALAERHGYAALVSWSTGSEGRFDVLLHDLAATPALDYPVSSAGSAASTRADWHRFASDPQLARRRQQLGPRLREALKASLPAHMLPAHIWVLGRLPLTTNGKLDERQLQALEPQRKAAAAWQAPQGDVEQTLARLWAQALGLEQVGRDEHFFELGGHSLLATQVVAQINQQCAVQLALRDFFAASDLAALARHVEQLQAQTLSSEALDAELSAALASIQGLSESQLQALIASAAEEVPS
ncbi:amino acid adenylation domain-containing protein [Pseudomonas sp. HR96]|uniref:non-ribosomal peptide synthetase n=1 Tax=Pseudomonas sp. HR96 TaxID=1027966 RepID=UPI002A7488C3|nr:non-ribosomal peptide synthetase [Pseudomonas sp. HR96]WPP02038.1 amino acid adenylation domain-containing protein [Pseudomonas sp. HR96]